MGKESRIVAGGTTDVIHTGGGQSAKPKESDGTGRDGTGENKYVVVVLRCVRVVRVVWCTTALW